MSKSSPFRLVSLRLRERTLDPEQEAQAIEHALAGAQVALRLLDPSRVSLCELEDPSQ